MQLNLCTDREEIFPVWPTVGELLKYLKVICKIKRKKGEVDPLSLTAFQGLGDYLPLNTFAMGKIHELACYCKSIWHK